MRSSCIHAHMLCEGIQRHCVDDCSQLRPAALPALCARWQGRWRRRTACLSLRIRGPRCDHGLEGACEMTPKNTICLWFDKDALDAARFYAATFPDSAVTGVYHAPADFPGGKQGDVLTVRFTVLGIPCLALNGGPAF